jgi:cytoskeletal protein RodZ
MKHDDIGARLHQARTRRGLTLEGISGSTKIPVRLLVAIEADDFARLPGGVFRRAYVRAFATEVGLDANELSKAYVESFEKHPGVDTAPPLAVAFADRYLTRRSLGAAAVAGAAIVAASIFLARSDHRRSAEQSGPESARDAKVRSSGLSDVDAP